ncbi:MAG: TonB-dependent receptor [Steroidobacteraceae bacterium]|nr:TonB-dependent receptor [Steroidobacteraceae bacterium]
MSRKLFLGAATVLAPLCLPSPGFAAEPASPLQTVVITASPLPQDADQIATIVETVERDAILRRGGANLADALSGVPGVTGTSFASGASRPVIRGFDANRVRTLEDGIGSFDVSDVGPDHGVPVDPYSAQRVEVVRGAATLRYGSQAIGGVVNAINDRVPTTLPEKPLSGEATSGYGTNAGSREGAALLDARLGRFALHADGFDRRTSDYDTPEGKLGNSFFRGDGYSAGGSYFFGENRVGAAVIHYDSKYGIPGEDAYIDMQQTKQLLRSSFAIGAGPLQKLDIEGGYADYEHSEREPDGTPASTFKNREWDLRAEGILGAVGPFSGAAFGAQAQRKNFSALGEGEDYLLPTLTRSEAVFAFTEAPLGGETRLQVGARVEQVHVEGTPASDEAIARRFTPASASAGLVFDVSPIVRLGVTLSSAARAPAQTELFSRGAHDGPATFEIGDPTLDVERANSLEGSLRVRTDKVRVEASLWGAKFDKYIFGQLTGRTCDEEGACVDDDSEELKEMYYTQLGAQFWGAEGKATFDLLRNAHGLLQAELLADYVRAKLDDGAGNVPRMPPYHVGGGLSWTGPSFDGGLLVKYAGAQTDTATAETRTGGFTSVDAQLGWRPLTASPQVEFVLIGRNLTDSTQRNSVALNKDEVILPGRDIRLLVRAVF